MTLEEEDSSLSAELLLDFTLLLDRSSTGAEDDDRTELLDCSVTLEEDDSTAGSSFCPADAEELSSHPTTANATISIDPIAALRLQDDRSRNFFIKAAKQYLSKENVIYFHPKKVTKGQSINTNAVRKSRTAKILEAISH